MASLSPLPAASFPSAVAGTFPADLTAAARVHADNARAAATLRAYEAAWRGFVGWCARYNAAPLPADPQTVAHFLVACGDGVAPATLAGKLAAIAAFHRTAGFVSPSEHGVVRAVFAGIRRERGVAPRRPKAALVVDELRDVLAAMGGHAGAPAGENEEDAEGAAAAPGAVRLIDVRDRALLLLGFAGALRRSEVVGLDVEDLRFECEGLVVRLRRSKTNQEGALEEVDILAGVDPATCPVRAVRAWLDAAALAAGPLFRRVDRVGRVGAGRLTAQIVAARLKKAVARVGLDPDCYGAHSLRSGFATTAARERKTEHAIMRHGRWKSIVIARRYIRDGARWQEHAAEGIGL